MSSFPGTKNAQVVWLIKGVRNHIQRTHYWLHGPIKIAKSFRTICCSSVSVLSLELSNITSVDNVVYSVLILSVTEKYLYIVYKVDIVPFQQMVYIYGVYIYGITMYILIILNAAICSSSHMSHVFHDFSTSTRRDAWLDPPAGDSIEEEPEEASIRSNILRQFNGCFFGVDSVEKRSISGTGTGV